ncbi:MAG: hypothetical protein ISN26_03665 [Betaproteobacteria bacterium AqS2]|uniref:LPS-assembly lipoprotein LptE n=1 Tax=Candidatus Amphirhobacter heronislandensis TaxID=1732024 RepID=A0A930UHF2_9GAMM|nr:hypothetical protein [Betaproteobacteria bacterium AqS2]
MRRALLAAALLLAGCGLQAYDPRGLGAGPFEIDADSPALAADLRLRIARLEAAGGRPMRLRLDEGFSSGLASRVIKGHATKRELRYELSYVLYENGAELHRGDFSASQVLDNDETLHRANLLSDERFIEQARLRGIDYLLVDLRRRLGGL